MSDDRTASEGDDLYDYDLHVKAKQDHTGATIILEGEFDMAGTDRFWRFQRSARGEPEIDHPPRSRPDIHRFVWPHGLAPCPCRGR